VVRVADCFVIMISYMGFYDFDTLSAGFWWTLSD